MKSLTSTVDPEVLAAEERRKARASQVSVVPTVSVPGKMSLKQIAEAVINGQQPAIEVPPEDWRAGVEQREREQKIQSLRNKWNAPPRQLLAQNLDRSGEWSKLEQKLKKACGSGFLIALIGTRGCGKTQVAVELMRQETFKLREAFYCTAIQFFIALRSTYKSKVRSEEDVVADYCRPSLLVIDEIARRGETDWENNMLFAVIDQRYREIKDTLIISNEERPKFVSSIGSSISDRMRETGGIIECNWQSYRQAA